MGARSSIHRRLSMLIVISAISARTALYLSSVTLISLMRGSVKNQPKAFCRPSAELAQSCGGECGTRTRGGGFADRQRSWKFIRVAVTVAVKSTARGRKHDSEGRRFKFTNLAGAVGFEPTVADPKSAALPLGHAPPAGRPQYRSGPE